MNKTIAGHHGTDYAKIFIMLILSGYVIRETWHIRYLSYMIFGCLIYIVYEVNYMYVFNGRLDIYTRGFGTLDNNGAALMIAMVIPFCYYFFQAERHWWRWGYLLCIIPVIHAVMLTYSRGAMLSCLAIGAGMILCSAKKRILQTIVIAAIMFASVLFLAGNEVRGRFLSISDKDRDESTQSRFSSWQAGWAIAKDYPLFGVGIRNSNLLTQKYGADKYGRTIHNVYIQVAADCGIVAGLIFVFLIVLSLWRLIKAIRMTSATSDDYEIRWMHYISWASFWSLGIFAFGAIFLSFETFETYYLLMLMGSIIPVLVKKQETTELSSEEAERFSGVRRSDLAIGGLSA
jgi:O-antigen ligase